MGLLQRLFGSKELPKSAYSAEGPVVLVAYGVPAGLVDALERQGRRVLTLRLPCVETEATKILDVCEHLVTLEGSAVVIEAKLADGFLLHKQLTDDKRFRDTPTVLFSYEVDETTLMQHSRLRTRATAYVPFADDDKLLAAIVGLPRSAAAG